MSGFQRQFNIKNLKYTVPTAWLSNKKKLTLILTLIINKLQWRKQYSLTKGSLKNNLNLMKSLNRGCFLFKAEVLPFSCFGCLTSALDYVSLIHCVSRCWVFPLTGALPWGGWRPRPRSPAPRDGALCRSWRAARWRRRWRCSRFGAPACCRCCPRSRTSTSEHGNVKKKNVS